MGVSVLIVEDDPLVAATLQHILVDRGHSVFLGQDGRAALKFLTRQKVDFVLLDIFMPDQDGIGTLREVKRMFPEITVGVMSGGGVRGRFDFLEMALRLGADGIAQKPITPEQLVAMVERGEFPSTMDE